MGIRISRPSDASNNKASLTKFGKIILAAVVIIVVVIVVGIAMSSSKNNQLDELRGELSTAVDTAITKCKSSVKAAGGSDADIQKVDGFGAEIASEKDVIKKSAIAKDCIAYVLAVAKGDTQITDELNGSQNKILVAEKNLNNFGK